MTALQRRSRPNGHDSHRPTAGDQSICPYCGGPTTKATLIRIAQVESARIAEAETALAAKFARERAQAEATKKADISAAVRKAVQVADTKLKLLRDAQAGAVAAALEQERKKAAKKLDEALGAEKAKHFEERQRLETSINDLRRKVQVRQHPVDVGDPLEVSL